jgi:uncharacterized SAM-binding protein YcdF (DUF218 family)
MLYLHKLLPFLLSPFLLLCFLISAGLIRKKYRLIWFSLFTMLFLSTPIVSNYLFSLLENAGSRKQPADMAPADAIVVLSGMTHGVPSKSGPISEWHDPDRFFGGIELMKSGLAPKLVFTKGRLPWRLGPTESFILEQKAIEMGILPNQILTAEEAENTEEEAEALIRLLDRKANHIILVTSSYHIPRAVMIFEKAGFRVQPYPVDFKTGGNRIVPMDFVPRPDGLSMVEKCVRETIGRIYYRLKS